VTAGLVLPIDVNQSDWLCTLEEIPDGGPAIRLGLRYINGLGESTAGRIVAERTARGPYRDITSVGERAAVGRAELVLIADAGAAPAENPAHSRDRVPTRRDAVWQAMAFDAAAKLLHRNHDDEGPDDADARDADDEPDMNTDAADSAIDTPALLPPQTPFDDMLDDFRSTGLTVGPHPMAFVRESLSTPAAPAPGQRANVISPYAPIVTAAELARMPDGVRASVAGMVIVRQRPPTARGFYFATVEDETGHAAVAVRPDLFAPNRVILSTARFLVFSGIVQNRDGVVSLMSDRFFPLDLPVKSLSRSFH